jgi:hypothetical protein
MRGEIQQQQKKDLYRSDNDGGVGEKPGVGLVPQPQYESISRKQQRPEQQRAFLPRPQRGELIRPGRSRLLWW